MAESQELEALKRRGRRRLIGAIALVLVAVIVLPMVFDEAPKQAPPTVSVRIPGENEQPFAPKPPPTPPAPAAAPVAPDPAPAPAAEKAAEASAAAKPAETAAPPAAAAVVKTEYVVQVIALADAARVKEITTELARAKIPHYTERVGTAKGPVTRVRAGPFPSQKAAEEAHARLKRLGARLGFTPGKIAPRTE